MCFDADAEVLSGPVKRFGLSADLELGDLAQGSGPGRSCGRTSRPGR